MSSWPEELRRLNIELVREVPRRSTEADVERAEKALGVKFPQSYCDFVLQIGPGRFGDLLEILVPWHTPGYRLPPTNVREYADSFHDTTGVSGHKFGKKLIKFAYVMLGAPPAPRVINARTAAMTFFHTAEITEGDEYAIYALDFRTAGPPLLVALANSFTELVADGFARKRLGKAPFAAPPKRDQFDLRFHPRELPAPPRETTVATIRPKAKKPGRS